MNDTTVRRIDVIERFKSLQTRQSALCDAICRADATLPAWHEGTAEREAIPPEQILEIRRSIADHIGKLWYQENEALRMPGLLACGKKTIALLQSLNFQKARFEKLMVRLRKDLQSPGAKLEQLLSAAVGKRDENIDQLLHAVGMKGINLSLCYRRFHQLPATIDSVSWTWSLRSRSIKGIDVQQAVALAHEKLGRQSTLDLVLEKLEQLPLDAPLAIVRPVQPILKANITFKDSDHQLTRKLITAHSPLFYLDTGRGLPRKNWPGYPDPDGRAPRLARGQRTLADTPYIRALNLYRYIT